MKNMKTKTNYLIVKYKKKRKSKLLNAKLIEGYELTKNRKKVINGVSVNNLVIVNEKFIAKVINKRVEKKFKSLLELVASVCEEDGEPGGAMMMALNEVEKFKRLIINQYASFMKKKEIEMLDKKIKLVENEVRMKLYQYAQRYEPVEEVVEKSGHRRR